MKIRISIAVPCEPEKRHSRAATNPLPIVPAVSISQCRLPESQRPLIERVRFYVDEPDVGYLTRLVDALRGRNLQAWTLADFEMLPPNESNLFYDEDEEADVERDDPGVQNLVDLASEFSCYLHREEGVPFTRGESARIGLLDYLFQRQEESLEPVSSIIDEAMQRKRPTQAAPMHPLCPDRVTLDLYLASLLRILTSRTYRAAATFAMIPA